MQLGYDNLIFKIIIIYIKYMLYYIVYELFTAVDFFSCCNYRNIIYNISGF